ncbi:hypothetical protein TNCV_1612061 [Trichonephila clavipes]|nr:hypothetical protein TNCV_1612061 [Trichonephila clavipes]
MEVCGMQKIFLRSEQKHGLKYQPYIGDGDSKTFLSIAEKEPYGDSVPIYSCVNCLRYPVTLRQKGLETIAILSQDNFAIAYTDGSSDRSLNNGGAGIILLLPDGNEDSPRQDKIICSMQTLTRSSTDAQSHLGMPNRRNKVTKNGNGPSEGLFAGTPVQP